MIDLSGNMKLSFGAKYVAEDTASYILYRFDRTSLDGRAVPVEKLARYLGLDVMCEYVTGDCTESMGVVAFEPQRIYLADGYVDSALPAAVAERDIIDRGECGLYRFAIALMCSEYLFYSVKERENYDGQLSFGLDSVASVNHKSIDICKAFDEIAAGEKVSDFALKLILPKNGFKRRTVEMYSMLGVNRATIDEEKHLPAVLDELASAYGVPQAAVLARLRQLNLY